MPNLTSEQEAELIDSFLSRQWPAENDLFEKLRPFLKQEIRHNFPKLWESSADLQQDAFLKLTQLRENPREVERIRPPLAKLAKYLIDAPAMVMLRSKRSRGAEVEIKDWHAKGPPDQTTSTYAQELMRLTSKLPDHLASALQLHAAHQLGEGRPLHEELGITQDGARRILVQAQNALLTLSRSEANDD